MNIVCGPHSRIYNGHLVPAVLLAIMTGLMAYGNAAAQTLVGDGPAFNNPRAIGTEPSGDFVVADFGSGHIFRVNAATGDRSLLSDNSTDEQGIQFGQPAGIVVLPDGRIFVSDLSLSAVVEVDPANGARSVLAGGDGGLLAPFGLAAGYINGAMRLIVADTGNVPGSDVRGPVLVDPDSGDIHELRIKRNNRIFYNDPRAVAVAESAGSGVGRIIVANFGTGQIISVHPASGERKIISQNPSATGPGVGNGPPFGSISDIAMAADGRNLLVVDLGSDSVLSVDLGTGDRTIVSTSTAPTVGDGDEFRSPHGIELSGDWILITDFGYPGILEVDPSGNRSLFSVTPVTGFVGIRAIELASDGSLIAADFGGNSVISVDRITGQRSLVASGAPFNGPAAVLELDADTLAVAQFQNPPGIFIADKATGDRGTLSGFGIGTGPEVAARGFILDPNDNNRILATSFNEDAVIAIDVITGDRSFVSKAGVVGDGTALNNPLGIAVDAIDGTIYVSDLGASAVFQVDLDGNRTVLSANASVGAGPMFESPFGISLIDGRLFVADRSGLIEIDLLNGDRTLLSPGGVLFSVRARDANSVFVSNFGAVQGIEIVDLTTGDRTVLSNADNP